MYSIEPKSFPDGEYINLTGNKLKTKFSIHEDKNSGDYIVTSARGNSELISFLNTLNYLNRKTDDRYFYRNYFCWDLEPSKVITVLNAVMRKFE
jgi:hypothetical protein